MVSFFNIKKFKSRKKVMESFFSINPNLGGLFRGLLWGGGGGGDYTHSCLKLVRIMLEASNLARKYSTIFSFRKYTF